MSEIPGSATHSAGTKPPLEKLNGLIDRKPTKFELVSRYGRYEVDGVPDFSPGSPASLQLNVAGRKKAKRQRVGKGETFTTANVDLTKCLSGEELLRACARGKFPMALRQRVKLRLPSAEQQQRMTGAKWKLRGSRMAILGWVAYAMVCCKAEALVITHGELAEAIELQDASWLGAMVRDLRAWGLLKQDSTWVKHGKATSRRGNVYRLTNVAAHVFRLDRVLDVRALPDPEPDTKPSAKRAKRHTNAQGKTPGHPESTPEVLTSPDESLELPSSTETLPIDGPISLPSSVASLPVDVRWPGAPAGSPDESAQPGIPGESCSASSRPLRPESREASRRVSDLMPGARRRVEDGKIHRGTRVLDVENGVYKRGVVPSSSTVTQREIDDTLARAKRVVETVNRRLAERGNAAALVRLDVPPPTDADAPVDEAASTAARNTELERYRAQLERDREEFMNTPRPRAQPDEESLEDVIAKATKTFEQTLEQKRFKRLSRLARRRGFDGGGDA